MSGIPQWPVQTGVRSPEKWKGEKKNGNCTAKRAQTRVVHAAKSILVTGRNIFTLHKNGISGACTGTN